MPVITFVGTKMDEGTKRSLIRELTVAGSAVTGIPPRFFTVVIEEHSDANIGVGGENLTEFRARLAAEAGQGGRE